jgi:hypothetical protein
MFIKSWCIAYKDGSEYREVFFERKNLIYLVNLCVEMKKKIVIEIDCLWPNPKNF